MVFLSHLSLVAVSAGCDRSGRDGCFPSDVNLLAGGGCLAVALVPHAGLECYLGVTGGRRCGRGYGVGGVRGVRMDRVDQGV